MIERLKVYITSEEYSKYIQPIFDDDTQFSRWLQQFTFITFDYLPPRIQQVVLDVYGAVPCMEISYTSGDFIRKRGDEVLAWMEEQRTREDHSMFSVIDR